MLTELFGKNLIQISKDFHEDFYQEEDNLEEEINRVMGIFTRRKLFQEILETHAATTGLEGFTILQAHGTDSSPWIFGDGKRKYNMQNWINKHDGYALALLIYACNKNNQEVQSQRSIVIHAPCQFNSIQFLTKKVHPRIYVPGHGYLEKDYRELRKVIDQLKAA